MESPINDSLSEFWSMSKVDIGVLRYVYPLFADVKELGVARGGEYGDVS